MSEENKKFVSYEDIQEALRLTAEAATKSDATVEIPTTHGRYLMDTKPIAVAIVENFAASLKQVAIQDRKPFKGQAWVDMASTHQEHAIRLTQLARGTNNQQERLDALKDAREHLHEARQLVLRAEMEVNESLRKSPGEAVKLADDFDVNPLVKKL
jgi:hypothetical protein